MGVADVRPMRILYYCQSLVGVGHLACSLRIIEALLPFAEVDLVHGGLDVAEGLTHPRHRSLRLATLLHDERSGELFDPDGARPVDEILADRRAAISRFMRWPYDGVVLEFYPFGRRRFGQEIRPMLEAVRQRCGPVPVFTSVRDVLVPRAIENERRMVESVRKSIHTVFVRGDPDLIRFDQTFSLASEIADRLCYTGYVSHAVPTEWPTRKPRILVSQGGGDVGGDLMQACIGAAALLPRFQFLLAAGSRTPPAALAHLRARVRSPNVEIRPFLRDFMRCLTESALSISLGGDNTLTDVLNARVPALAYPYQDNPEQRIRIRGFAASGLVHELDPTDLVPERLKARIEAVLAAPYPSRKVATDGAAVTSERIRAVIERGRRWTTVDQPGPQR